MRKSVVILFFGIVFAGCGIHQGVINNPNVTNVVLSGNNYKIVKQVKGRAKTVSVFGFGGVGQKDLVAKAREDMLKNIDMVGLPRAIINETVETHHSFFPFCRNYTVSISAYIVEFTGGSYK